MADERKKVEAADAEGAARAAEAAVVQAREAEAAAKARAVEQAADEKRESDVRASVVLSFHPARLNNVRRFPLRVKQTGPQEQHELVTSQL